MIQDTNTMSLQHFHDFYYIMAVEHAITSGIVERPELEFSKAVEKLQSKLDDMKAEIVPNIAVRTFVYLYAACIGEARHAADSEAEWFFIPEITKRSRSDLYSRTFMYRPTVENIQTIISIFCQKWHSGFGGIAWKNIAEALLEYYALDNASWIDHVIDLEHNNGTAFSKTDAVRTLHFDPSYSGRFRSFLDYKFSHDILVEPYYRRLHVTPSVKTLVERYCTIFNKDKPEWLVGDLDELTPYPVEWGNKKFSVERKWGNYKNVHHQNSPNGHDLMDASGIQDINMHILKLAQYKASVKKAVIETIAKYKAGKEDIAAFKEMAENHVQTWAGCCKKIHKYAALPCTIKKSGKTGWDVIVPLPLKSGKRDGNTTIFKSVQIYAIEECEASIYPYSENGFYFDTPFGTRNGHDYRISLCLEVI